jgi:hypothetical protein
MPETPARLVTPVTPEPTVMVEQEALRAQRAIPARQAIQGTPAPTVMEVQAAQQV